MQGLKTRKLVPKRCDFHGPKHPGFPSAVWDVVDIPGLVLSLKTPTSIGCKNAWMFEISQVGLQGYIESDPSERWAGAEWAKPQYSLIRSIWLDLQYLRFPTRKDALQYLEVMTLLEEDKSSSKI